MIDQRRGPGVVYIYVHPKPYSKLLSSSYEFSARPHLPSQLLNPIPISTVKMPFAKLDSEPYTQIQLWAIEHPDDHGKVYLCNNQKLKDAQGRPVALDNCLSSIPDESNRDKFQVVREKDGWLAADDGRYIQFLLCHTMKESKQGSNERRKC
jgi:hypothetical protein